MTAKRRGLGRGLDALIGEATAETLSAVSDTSDNDSLTLVELPIERIQRSPYQPRRHFEPTALQELADSIQAQGILQPIVVRRSGEEYEIVAGERRWRAAQLAGLATVPVVVKDLSDQATAAVALIENLQREDLNPLEQATALQRLVDEFGMTHEAVAAAVGRSRAGVTNLLRLLELTPEVKSLLEQGEIDMGHARALLSLPPAQQISLARQAAQQKWSVRVIEKQVKQALQPIKPAATTTTDSDILRLEQELADQLAAVVKLQHTQAGKGKLIINYSSVDELDGILQRLRR